MSNRANIEKRFAKIPDDCNCRYESEKYTFRIVYSDRLCYQYWNVPVDTVIEVNAKPKNKLTFDDLKINDKNFYITNLTGYIPHPNGYYISLSDLKNGVRYFFNSNNEFELLQYFPTLYQGSDVKLRCRYAPPYLPMNETYQPSVLTYSENLDIITNESIRIFQGWDSYNSENMYDLYIIVYFSKGYSKKRQIALINKSKNKFREVFKARKIDSKNIKVLNAGIRPKFEIEGFILPKDYPPPTPNP